MWLIANLPLLTSPLRGQSRLLLGPGPVAQTPVRSEPELGTLLANPTKMQLTWPHLQNLSLKQKYLFFCFFFEVGDVDIQMNW